MYSEIITRRQILEQLKKKSHLDTTCINRVSNITIKSKWNRSSKIEVKRRLSGYIWKLAYFRMAYPSQTHPHIALTITYVNKIFFIVLGKYHLLSKIDEKIYFVCIEANSYSQSVLILQFVNGPVYSLISLRPL